MQSILITGGAGYIGSHAAVELLSRGYDVTLYDNLSNSSLDAITRMEKLVGQRVRFVNGDIRDAVTLSKTFAQRRFDAVMHFAGLKAVAESVAEPLRYFDNNVAGTVALLREMELAGCRRIVFSSSATVYAPSGALPLSESAAVSPSNPYGWSKLQIEQMLASAAESDPRWSVAILRYFNPAGAHPSGLIGERPTGTPNNLVPYVSRVAKGELSHVRVFGQDYETADGTGIRDYIHILDLVGGHLAALDWLREKQGHDVFNLGTGQGYSVLQMIRAFERASGRSIPYQPEPRRPGDVAECVADASKARSVLGWKAKRDIDEICADEWRWQVRFAEADSMA